MNIEKKRAFIIQVVYICIVLALIYIGIKYVMYAIMPFVLGFAIAFILRPLSLKIVEKLKVPPGVSSIVVLLIFYGTIVFFLMLLSMRGFVALRSFTMNLPVLYRTSIEPNITVLLDQIQAWVTDLDPSLKTNIEMAISNISSSLAGMITSLSGSLLSFLSGVASGLPSFFVSFFFMLISSFFFAIDYRKITGFIMRQFSPKTREIIIDAKDYMVGSVFKLLWGYAKIMTITFIELSIGLSIIGVDNAIMLALVISIFDILPVLGTGGIMIPWIIIAFVNGQVKLGVGLLIIYIIITVIRNIIEPKIVGQTIGLHPILMLMCMFIGAKLLGALGIIIMPIAIIVIQNLNNSGKLKIYKP